MLRLNRRFRQRDAKYVLQLTAMVDLFTILLVFLLKSYSTSSVQMTKIDDLRLPDSVAAREPDEALKLVVSQKGIYVDDKKVVSLKDGNINNSELDKKDKYFLRALYNELDKQASKQKEIAVENKTVKFSGKVILQADQNLNYATLKKVMYTAMLAGYADLKLGAIGME